MLVIDKEQHSPQDFGFVHNPQERLSSNTLVPIEQWEELSGSGFDPWLEVANLYLEYHKGGLDRALKSFHGNIIGVQSEYMLRRALLGNPIRKGLVDNQERLLPFFGDDPLEEVTSVKERAGTVKRNVQGIEDHILKGKDKMSWYISVKGDSGLVDSQGNKISYPDTQIFMFRNNQEGELEGLTLITDLTQPQVIAIQKELGFKFRKGKTNFETICNLNGNLISRAAGEEYNSFEEVVGLVEKTVKSPYVRTIKTKNGQIIRRTFAQVYQDLQRKDQLLKMNAACEGLVASFDNYLNNSQELLEATIPGLEVPFSDLVSMDPDQAMDTLKPLLKDSNEARLLLKQVSRLVLDIQKATGVEGIDISNWQQTSDEEYEKEYKEFKAIGGCGGGEGEEEEMIIVMTLNGPMRIKKYFNCPKDKGGCGRKIHAGQGITTCPHCGLKASEIKERCV